MKKTLFFSSMLATLATAGSALMMTAAPVMADTANSDLLMEVDGGETFSLIEVPGFDYDAVSADEIFDGFSRSDVNANITGQENLTVRDTRDRTDYLGWDLKANITTNFTSTTDSSRVLASSLINLSNANADDTLTIKDGAALASGVENDIASVGSEAANKLQLEAENPIGDLIQDASNVGVSQGEGFQGEVTWTLNPGTTTPEGL